MNVKSLIAARGHGVIIEDDAVSGIEHDRSEVVDGIFNGRKVGRLGHIPLVRYRSRPTNRVGLYRGNTRKANVVDVILYDIAVESQQDAGRLVVDTIEVVAFGYPFSSIAQEGIATIPIKGCGAIACATQQDGGLHVVVRLRRVTIEVERNLLVKVEQILSGNAIGQVVAHKGVPVFDGDFQHFVVGVGRVFNHNCRTVGRGYARGKNAFHLEDIAHIAIFEIAQNDFTSASGHNGTEKRAESNDSFHDTFLIFGLAVIFSNLRQRGTVSVGQSASMLLPSYSSKRQNAVHFPWQR